MRLKAVVICLEAIFPNRQIRFKGWAQTEGGPKSPKY